MQGGIVADTPDRAVAAAKELQQRPALNGLSEVPNTCRRAGKGTIKESGTRVVVLAKSTDEVFENQKAILGEPW